jgi:basic membrane lipoprotein Med (substrate-binding protein (PBP1-ABC) superfamily)
MPYAAGRRPTVRVAPPVALAVLLVVGVLTGCRSSAVPPAPVPLPEAVEPPAPMGATVAVVLPPSDEVDERVLVALEASVAALGADAGTGIREVRAYRSTSSAFVGDLVGVLAERGTDLICVIGSTARSVVVSGAERYPHLRYCAAPSVAGASGPPNATLLEVRTGELGYVVGVAASSRAGDGPVGVVLSAAGLHGAAFRTGLLVGLDEAQVIEVPLTSEVDATTAVQLALDAGARVVVVDGVLGAGAALELAAASAWVLGPAVIVDTAAIGDRTVLTWRTDWLSVLRRPVEQLLEGDEPAPSLGFAEEVFEVEFGAGATSAVRRLVGESIDGIVAGSIDPLDPATVGPPPDEGS